MVLSAPLWLAAATVAAAGGTTADTEARTPGQASFAAFEDYDDADDYRAPRWLGWGIRVGVASDPDQVLAGVQFDFGDVARRVYLEPNIELGVGDDHTILKTTGALQYRFQRQRSFRPFVGGGVTLGLDYFDPPDRGSRTDVELALRLLGGGSWVLKSKREFFIEGAWIIGDLHDFQLVVGWRL
jgi:hypothetical protein